MRAIRTQQYKLIWNIAHPLPFPFASDLWASSTWQDVLQNRIHEYGMRKTTDFLQRPEFGLYDLQQDPQEIVNLAHEREHRELLLDLQTKLKHFQKRTKDPWLLKRNRE